jgi:hypothetical protein
MTISTVLTAAATLAAAILVTQVRQRTIPTIALVAAGVELLLLFRVVSLKVSGMPLTLVLGGALLVAGGIAWSRADAKMPVTCASIITLVGAVQVLALLF